MNEKGKVLIVEDEQFYCDDYEEKLTEQDYNSRDYHIEVAMDLETAATRLRELTPEVVLLDLRFPPRHEPEDGLGFLKEIHEFDRMIKVIVVTGAQDDNIALKAIGSGAYDFVEKDTESHLELPFRVNQAYERLQLERELVHLQQEHIGQIGGYLYGPGQMIIGTSEAMQGLYRKIDQVAPTMATVLIRGESGTGKELISQAIHYHSPRRQRLMVNVNCGAIPAELIESELFGHVKGAFTGAHRDKKGLFEQASGSTLFLDEIGDLPLPLQVKLLRAIQEGEIQRVGDTRPIQVDTRLIAATNRDLEGAIKAGTFREDLYFRLDVFRLEVLPLRERKPDIPLLAEHFLQAKATQFFGKSKFVGGFQDDAINLLMNHSWPGNVRELGNVIERAVILDQDGWISVDDIQDHMKEDLPHASTALPDLVALYEKRLILDALEMSNSVKTKAAKSLGIPEGTLRAKMKSLDIT